MMAGIFSHWTSFLFIIALPAAVVVLALIFTLRRPFMASLNKKHVFITGGSSGIGLAIAKTALQDGANVTLVSRSMSNLRSAAEGLTREVQCSPDRIRCEAADVGDYEAISAALTAAWEWKPIDVLVCNAGLTRGGYLGEGSVQDLEITVRTNFMGTVNPLHAALPQLKERSRSHPISLVITASLASLFFMYGHCVYSATKYAVRGLAEGLRFELLPYKNIRLSLICPGFISTPFLDEADKDKEIKGLLKWVNFYSRKYAGSPNSVARKTIGAIKSGSSSIVTTNLLGLILACTGRGLVPADNVALYLLELIMFLPIRLVSSIVILIFRIIVRRKAAISESDYLQET